ncbi:hydroxymethylbilane synthase [Desulfovibrio inopinatus]|uniref:hydroxymethylbilane synthase n=1 Tax=Desulfovibrio inopinatus TaxID=102109 RepID=UPI00041D5D16|nr:hydroxymethylbilane synthase [Desulfovibrio inopinatus]
MSNSLTIATRGSKLALWQAHHISAQLVALHPGLEVSLEIIKTKGDKILDVPLAKVGGKGLFVKEIEDALLTGHAHLAVHSMKDVPVEQPDGLVLGVVPEREDHADMLLSVKYDGLDALPHGARVGTSSLRRQCQLMGLRQDLCIESLRGNLDTRVNKLLEGQYDAIVVAAAGLNRLGITTPKMFRLEPPVFLPAVGQGALGLEYRADDTRVASLVAPLNHSDTADCVAAERGFLTGLDGGCQVPIAAHARFIETGDLRLTGLVADPEGQRVIRKEVDFVRSEAFDSGMTLAAQVLEAGGRAILDEMYSSSN